MITPAIQLYRHAQNLYPICRSITGPGLRETLRYVASYIPLQQYEVPTGTKVLDWEIPQEWTPRSARLSTLGGRVIVDFADHNLHLLQYSHAVDRVVPRDELEQHLHSLPEQPDLIPYRTAYYRHTWGFCLPHRLREELRDAAYHVEIDADLRPGSLTYGECILPGATTDEVLVSMHCCHPSLANDNLSGITVGIEMAKWLQDKPRRLTWRFLFMPGTIGAITWLAFHRDVAANIRHGMVLSCLGDAAPLHWKQTRAGNAAIDRAMAHVLRHDREGGKLLPFTPYGYDERQYASPGFALPVGRLTRSPEGGYAQYHTSADDLSCIIPERLGHSLEVLQRIATLLEDDKAPYATCPYGEPQLGRHGLYSPIGGQPLHAGDGRGFSQTTLLWLLNLADGAHSLLDVAERADVPFSEVLLAAQAAKNAGLLCDTQAV